MRYLWISLLMVLTACAGNKKSAQADAALNSAETWDTPCTILSAAVEGDSLRMTLQFGGGFRTHEFRLESGGAATKSMPRQQPLRLKHNSHGDMGRALLREDHAFDLRPYRDPTQAKIRVRLTKWPDLLAYTYSD